MVCYPMVMDGCNFIYHITTSPDHSRLHLGLYIFLTWHFIIQVVVNVINCFSMLMDKYYLLIYTQ